MSVTPFLVTTLRYGGILAALVGIVGSVIGFLVAGLPGLFSGLLGAGAAAVFLGLTAVSIIVAGRVTGGDMLNPLFFGIVLGAFFLKLVVFFVLSLLLRGQEWLSGGVFSGAVIAAVLGSLIVDAVALQRSRVPYVSDVELPGDRTRASERSEGRPDA